MVYEEVVEAVRKTFENSDARNIFEHIAVEVDIVGEVSGAFYIEVAERFATVEPYNYYDHDVLVKASARTIVDIAEGRLNVRDAINDGLVDCSGDIRKLNICLDKLKF